MASSTENGREIEEAVSASRAHLGQAGCAQRNATLQYMVTVEIGTGPVQFTELPGLPYRAIKELPHRPIIPVRISWEYGGISPHVPSILFDRPHLTNLLNAPRMRGSFLAAFGRRDFR